MTPVDIVTVIAAGLVGLTVFARAELVSPRVRSSYASNGFVRFGMDAVALVTVFVIFEVVGGAHVPDAVAWFFVIAALTSTAMLISMFVHDGREVLEVRRAETRAADVQDMKEAVAETVPPVVERSLERVVTGFAEPAADYDRLIRIDPVPPRERTAD
ncbi:hypothetical protein [Brevundimonas mediterranea]|jgi:hypothetical protein|uniref:Uncharacterized protein n=1 Tax=Brevundimonas mediterranea TaxID=74329 RepID=A0A7Z8Y626_9CAUL|nr:hypothetical protein [Brevundimonas mediterranea]VDC51448.1 hypothetical protein BREV_BREV_00517 [Brevundimonas mediterranea]